MSKESKTTHTLTDDEIVTARKVSRRTLLAGAGVAIGAAALAGGSRSALAADKAEKDKGDKAEKDPGDKAEKDKAEKDKSDKSKIETTRDKD